MAVPQTPSSAIYWTGLHTWRIRSFSDARPRYHRWLDSGGSRAHLGLSEEDAGYGALWHEFIDVHDLLSNPNMGLTSEEAAFLRTRILAIKDNPKRSLLKDLAASGPLAGADFLWDVAVVADGAAALSAEAHDAQRLSAALHGAMLTYNYRCAQLREHVPWIEAWSARSQRWWDGDPRSTWASWNLESFWTRVLALPGGLQAVSVTRPFLEAWVSELRRKVSVMPAERESARRAVERREKQVKRNRARLIGGPALRTWDGAAASGPTRCGFAGPRRRASCAISTVWRVVDRRCSRRTGSSSWATLLPPEGYEVDALLATTFSLDLAHGAWASTRADPPRPVRRKHS